MSEPVKSTPIYFYEPVNSPLLFKPFWVGSVTCQNQLYILLVQNENAGHIGE